jgi:hypothetical protein
MNDFFNSKFVQDLQNGKLPTVEVEISTESLIQMSVCIGITAIAVIIAAQIFKKI